MNSLGARLSLWTIVVIGLLEIAVGIAATTYVSSRSTKLADASLMQQAEALLHTLAAAEKFTSQTTGGNPRTVSPADARQLTNAFETHIGFQYWDAHNSLRVSSDNFSSMRLDAAPAGFIDMPLGTRQWRILTLLDGDRWIRVGQRVDVYGATKRSTAIQSLIVVVLGLPLLLFLSRITSRIGFEPIAELAERLDRCVPGRGGPVGLGDLPREFVPIIASVNALLARCGRIPPMMSAASGKPDRSLRNGS